MRKRDNTPDLEWLVDWRRRAKQPLTEEQVKAMLDEASDRGYNRIHAVTYLLRYQRQAEASRG